MFVNSQILEFISVSEKQSKVKVVPLVSHCLLNDLHEHQLEVILLFFLRGTCKDEVYYYSFKKT